MPFPPAHPSLLRAISERGYSEPTPAQEAVLKPEALGRDLLVSARTGSGKTVAYGLAMAPTLLGESERFGPGTEPLALVVAPTRELALQVQRELEWLYAPTGARIVACVGGMDIRREQRLLAQGAHVVVGTPGRLCDHLDRGQLSLSAARAVVLDEADEMLDLGFREDLERILDSTPADRRTLLFSATIPKGIAMLAKRFQRDAHRIAATPENEAHGDIEYRAILIAPQDRDHAVVNVLRFFEAQGALVFCATREGVRELHGNLVERGFSVAALSGELSQGDRVRALQALRDGRARVCVATDVAARGLDLPDLGLVIHADLPNDRDTLLHRAGRTGRAGKKGVCALLVPYTRRRLAERLLIDARVQGAWSPPPSADDIRAKDQERLVREIVALAEGPSEEDLVVARALLADRTPEAVAAALVRLKRSTLPAPEEMAETAAILAPRPSQAQAESTGSVWFHMNVGRDQDADPRWVLPFLCRRGHITRQDIGKIDILQYETQFEISPSAAGRFAAAIRHRDPKDRDLRIEPMREARPRPGAHRVRPASKGPRARPGASQRSN